MGNYILIDSSPSSLFKFPSYIRANCLLFAYNAS